MNAFDVVTVVGTVGCMIKLLAAGNAFVVGGVKPGNIFGVGAVEVIPGTTGVTVVPAVEVLNTFVQGNGAVLLKNVVVVVVVGCVNAFVVVFD
jgi:hypothetical protein